MNERAPTSDDAPLRRKRVRYRCWHRGTKELDLLLGPFADRHLDRLSEAQVGRLEALLELPENDLFDWITGKAAPAAAHDDDVLALLRNFIYGR